jgi:4-hydroxybutyrate dehydrogenase
VNEGVSTFSFPTRILFGAGALAHLSHETARWSIERPLLVTDRGIVKTGLDQRVTAAARGLQFALFAAVDPNPVEQNIREGIEMYRSEGCDAIVAVGGGSPIDAGKLIRLGITHRLPLEEYDDQRDGSEKISGNLPPMIAIPTTSGTGSEVGRSAVVQLKATGRKTVIFSPHLIANVAIDDPELTVGMPPPVTAGTGLDALTHNVEAYLAKGYHPMCDAIALSGARLAYANLPAAVRNGRDLVARTNMMMASMMGAVAFQKGLGVTHSLAHPLSSVAGLHHGTTNGILLPHVLEFNRSVSKDRLRDLAMAMHIVSGPVSMQDAGTALIEAIRHLLKEVGIPDRLSALGIRREMVPELSQKAMEDACHLLNPRPCTREDMTALYERAL